MSRDEFEQIYCLILVDFPNLIISMIRKTDTFSILLFIFCSNK